MGCGDPQAKKILFCISTFLLPRHSRPRAHLIWRSGQDTIGSGFRQENVGEISNWFRLSGFLRSVLLAQDQQPVALLDADKALEKALAEQIHLARLRRQNEGLDVVHIKAAEAEAA